MALQHKLSNARMRVPKLDTTVFGTTENPITVWCKSHTENKVLYCNQFSSPKSLRWVWTPYFVAFEGANALAAWLSSRDRTRWSGQFPHLDSLVQTTANQSVSRRSKSDRVHAVLVSKIALKTNNELAGNGIPDPHALIKGARGNEAVIRGDGNCRHAILDGQMKYLRVGLKIPQADSTIATARCNNPAIAGEVKGINVLVMASELVLNSSGRNIPDLDQLVECTMLSLKKRLTLITLSSAPVARYAPLGLKHTLLMYKSPSSGRVPSCR